MKRFTYLFALLGLVASLNACNKDGEEDVTPVPPVEDEEDNTPVVEDSFTYGNKTYDIKSAIIIDFGPMALTDGDDTHYNYTFVVSDGTFSSEQNAEPTLSGATYMLMTSLDSKNTASFSGGTFNWINSENFTADQILNKDITFSAILIVDGNNDGILDDDAADIEHIASGGNIVVTGSGTNYSITYDLSYGGSKLEGNYEGAFTIFDGALFDNGNGDGNRGSFNYNGGTVVANSGLIDDWGGDDWNSDGTNDFYNYDFYITDGFFDGEGDNLTLDGNPTYFVYAELFSPSANSFEAGTFNFVEEYNVQSTDQFFFSYAVIEIDLNGDGDFDDANEYAEATGGSVTVTGADRNYSLTFNLNLNNGQTLTGSYSGDFSYYSNNEGARRAQIGRMKTNQPSKISKGKMQIAKK